MFQKNEIYQQRQSDIICNIFDQKIEQVEVIKKELEDVKERHKESIEEFKKKQIEFKKYLESQEIILRLFKNESKPAQITNDEKQQKENLNNLIINQISRAHHFKDNEGMDKLITEGQSKQQNDSSFKSKLKRWAYSFENYLKMLFMMTTYWFQGIAHYVSIIICILAIIRQLKRPRMTKQYVQQLAQNQFAQNLIYVLVFCFYREQRNIFYFFPLMLHFWVGICEYLNIMKNNLYKKGEKIINRTRENKDRIILLKSQYEIFYFPVLFVEIFFGRSSIFLVIFYYNFIKIKYLISPSTNQAFQKLNNGIKGVLNAPGVPKFVGVLYQQVEKLFGWLVKHEPSSKRNVPQPPPTPTETKTEVPSNNEEQSDKKSQ